jgi:hypothetical protein
VHYDEVYGTWTRLEPPAGYAFAEGKVAAMISHFSLYGVIADISSSNEAVTTPCYTWAAYVLPGLASVTILFLIFIKRRKKYEKSYT